MRVVIEADSEKDAQYLIMGKIIFHKIEPKEDDLYFLKDIFNLK